MEARPGGRYWARLVDDDGLLYFAVGKPRANSSIDHLTWRAGLPVLELGPWPVRASEMILASIEYPSVSKEPNASPQLCRSRVRFPAGSRGP